MRYKPVTYTTFEAHLEKVKIDKEKAEEKEKARLQRRKQQKCISALFNQKLVNEKIQLHQPFDFSILSNHTFHVDVKKLES